MIGLGATAQTAAEVANEKARTKERAEFDI